MMKGGKDEEKRMGPLFPRLHIKDAEQGGPKAPPRNKMALYEQLSIPSQKFTSGSASISPFPPNSGGNAVPLTPSSHGGGHKRSLYGPICNLPAPSHLPKKLPSYSSDAMNLCTTSTNLEWKPMKPTNHHPLNGAYSSLFQPHSTTNSKNSSTKELLNEVDYKVPTFRQSRRTLTYGSRDKNTDKEKGAMVPFNEEKRSSLVDESSGVADSNGQLYHKNRTLEGKKALRDDFSTNSKKGVERGNASILEGVSGFHGDNYRSHNRLEDVTKCYEDQCGPLPMGEVDRTVDVSDTSMVDSVSGVEISPDDVVGVIGQKQFLETRRAIVHQQRVFAVQVFELHRLIKVQRLFAASPELLIESELYLGKSSIRGLPTKKLPSGNLLEAPPLLSKLKPQKPNRNLECAAEDVLEMPLFPSLSDHSNMKLNTPKSNCYFHPPPVNQWLVPIISPSEGLVYKPFTGPTPPTSGFGVPVYGITTSTHQEGIGILPGTPPFSHTYFPPYRMPSIPSVASSAVEVARQLTKPHPNGQEEKSYFFGDSQASSGHTERVVQGDALSLFPTDPTVKASDQSSQSCSNEQQTRVIKVVPHNPRSASESAARIFQSIQEERRQYT